MAEFSAKERMIAALLSQTPGIKRLIKKWYVEWNAIIHRKPYIVKILDNRIKNVYSVMPDAGNDEIFFGYYDKCCSWGDKVLFHRNTFSSLNLPRADKPCGLYLKDLKSNKITKIGTSHAYNWQQGCRIHWISEDKILYNTFDENSQTYKAVMWSVAEGSEICRYDMPVQDSMGEDFFLSINYRRLWNMRPDYCYRCMPMLNQAELEDVSNDGIWKVDMSTQKVELLHSIAEVIKVDYREQFAKCNHNVNHVMLSPNGKRFIFIHRNYLGKQRFDRLMLSDFKNLKVVIDEHYVSHCCWIDNSTILGYLMSGGERGFFYIDVDTLNVTKCEAMSAINAGDGHPSYNGRIVVFDTYPDKSRMQKLYIYDTQKKKVFPLLELYQSTQYIEETRCDLHPRFSHDGRKIFFDTVYHGHRELCYVDISEFYE